MRLSVPSYVIPGTYAENLRWLEANTDQRQVELLFFMYDDDVEALFARELPELTDARRQFSFTAHLPDPLLPGQRSLVERLDGLAESFVVHPPRDRSGIPAFTRLLDEWRATFGQRRFFLENTRLADFEPADAALAESAYGPPPLCADLGHLAMEGRDPAVWTLSRADRVAEIHAHGWNGRNDHVPFGPNEPWLAGLADFLKGFPGVIELELFSWHELEPCLNLMRGLDSSPEKGSHP
ncbi:MAG TPA: cobamide remodeling phosphodiesterase CbiR [Spirochaetales bacterium]|nr:cobamide remodeling phosphodiesterase CbiR [Spirochaetales bacterium]